VFRWRPWVSASFAWQAWDNVHCQGVGCTPWRSAGVPGSPPLLRGRRRTMCTAKYALASLWRPWVSVAGVGQCALPRGRMYALGFLWRSWVSASFAWQAWDTVLTLIHTHSLTHSLDITLLRDTHTYSYCVSAVAS